jgi:hypothetical protein
MRTYLDRFHVGSGTTVGPLTVFPLWSEAKPVSNYTTPRASNLRVTELAEPQITQLTVTNGSSRGLLIPEGTILDGGFQTRVVERDIFVAPGASRAADVRCVEQGRWHGNLDHAVDGRAPISVIAALRGIGDQHPDMQHRVWSRVSKIQDKLGHSATSNLLDVMADQGLNEREERKADSERRLRREAHQSQQIAPHIIAELERVASVALPGQAGVLVGVGGRPIALELHGNHMVLSRQIQQMLKAILLDASTIEWRPTRSQLARDFAEEILYTPIEVHRAGPFTQAFKARGESADIRATASARRGATLHAAIINHRHEVALAA